MASDLVVYVNKLLNVSLDLTAEIKKNDLAAVVAAVAPHAPQLLELDVETDVEGCFNMFFDVIRQLPEKEATAELKKLLATFTSNTDSTRALLNLRIATNLFNKCSPFPELRFGTLLQVIAFASTTDNLELVSSYFDDVEALLDTKTLTTEKKRKLYLAIADVLQASETKNIKVLLFLEKYLATFAKTTDAKELAIGKDVAVRAIKLVLQNPIVAFVARVDLIANPVVQSLQKCSTNSKLFEVFDIVSTKTLTEFTAFQKATGAAFFKDIAVEEADLASTMRLFTLCTLPTGFDEISYATIAKALAITEDEVEQWVVKAITSSLITAKIDQLRRTVVISRALQRDFGVEQWKEIHVKLQLYKKNVGALLDVVRNARLAHQQK